MHKSTPNRRGQQTELRVRLKEQIEACSNLPGTRGLSGNTKELIEYARRLPAVDHQIKALPQLGGAR
jgi:hypothetical protein